MQHETRRGETLRSKTRPGETVSDDRRPEEARPDAQNTVATRRGVSAAFILPRYGKSLGGGAETLARELLLRWAKGSLTNELPLSRLEVWTTCAVDHRTWDNHHKPGVVEEDGVCVRRFRVDSRDVSKFLNYELRMADGWPLSVNEQLEWMRHSVNSTDLYAHIARHGADYDYLFFAPYLFATSFWGALIHPTRSILIPCLHDEHYAYLDIIKYQLTAVRGLLFNTAAERDLAYSLYGESTLADKSAVVGMGFDHTSRHLPTTSASTQRSGHASINTPGFEAGYLLYSGRKEQGKNLDLLIEYYSHYRSTRQSCLPLVLIGSGSIEFLPALPDGVVDLGFVSEDEKWALLSEATLLIQPSTNESFSIVLMEAWLSATPVLVHANCPVTREHVVNSGGGLYFSNLEEFILTTELIVSNNQLAQSMGMNGLKYVTTEYSWTAVGQRFASALCTLSSENRDSHAA